MFKKIVHNISRGFNSVRNNRQLGYTIVVAIIIFSSFFFVVDRFVNIAEDAQERLINVRVGSIQDAFVAFAPDHLNDQAFLVQKMEQIRNDNRTITDFQVIIIGDGGVRTIFASLNGSEIGRSLSSDANDLLDFALIRETESITIPTFIEGERFFTTIRAILEDDIVRGFVVTRQTFSEADRALEAELRNSTFVFAFIVIIMTLLFFRYARIIDYATLYRKLQEIDQLKDDFIAMASHELRSPLTSIRGYVELILDDKKTLSTKQKEYAGKVEVSARQLTELVGDMLDVSRIEQGRMTFDNTDFNIAEVVSEVREAFARVAENKGLVFKIEGPQEINVHLDRNKVHRILVNLISNAIKYTNDGDVVISYKEEGAMVSIRVSDSGIGISKENQEKLFQKFHRIASKETEDVVGSGLGLWLTRAIILKLKGSISVESIAGVGTHFIVLLPRIVKK